MQRARSHALSPFNIASLALGLAFLYLPIVILVIYSFNASRLVTVWGGWSLRWYRNCSPIEAMLAAAWMSLRVGVASATAGDGARHAGGGRAVARRGAFADAALFSAMLYAPLVMPEVITGLSLAVAVRRGRRRARLLDRHGGAYHADDVFRRGGRAVATGGARSQSGGSRDGPWLHAGRAFIAVTLPLIWPAIAAGWMLAFTLSLDDVVIASFATGPGRRRCRSGFIRRCGSA